MKNQDKEIINYFEEFSRSINGNFFQNDEKIDAKHKILLSENLKKINHRKEFFLKNFRSNEDQDDLGSPPQISFEHFKNLGIYKTLNTFFFKTYSGLFGYDFKRSFFDDIATLERIGAKKIMDENPVHLTPNCYDFYCYKNTSLNLRWIRYLYFCQRIISNKLLKKNSVWVDIGSYYGGLQSLIYKNIPDIKIFLVDFKPQLCKSYIFLKKLFPDAKHILPDEISSINSLSSETNSYIAYLPADKFEDHDFGKVGLLTNFFSFGEMKRDTFNSYYSEEFLNKVNNIYTANRFISAPHFEKTYDSDLNILDYLTKTHKLQYLDILPIHFYFLNKRTINGVNAFRPLSSPYFEMIFEK